MVGKRSSSVKLVFFVPLIVCIDCSSLCMHSSLRCRYDGNVISLSILAFAVKYQDFAFVFLGHFKHSIIIIKYLGRFHSPKDYI